MNWKNEAIEKLEQYAVKKQALVSIPEEIEYLESAAKSIRSATADNTPVKSDVSRREDILLSNIVKREELKWSLEQTQKWVNLVDAGLNVLNSEERLILERFYINSVKGAADRLAGDLALDIKTIYRRKDSALRRFTIALFGSTES